MTALMGLGCDCQQHNSSMLGAVTKAQTEAFFIGPMKYVRNTKPTPIYVKPGEAPIKTIPPNDNMGRIVALNAAGNWGKLESGYYVYLADSMYTVILDEVPPDGFFDGMVKAAKEVVEDAASFGWDKLKPVVITGVVLLGVFWLGKTYIEKKAEKAAVA